MDISNRQIVALSLAATLSICTFFFSPASAAPDYKAYSQALSTRIKWDPAAELYKEGDRETVRVEFKIAPGGEVSEVKAIESCGNAQLDALAVDAIKNLGKLPPLPASSNGLVLSWVFPLKRGNSTHGVDLGDYHKKAYQAINNAWWVPPDLIYKKVELEVTIAADGAIKDVRVHKSSQDPTADKLAVLGVRKASPLPPLPAGVDAPFTIIYTLGQTDNSSKNFAVFNGKTYGAGEAYETAGGSKVFNNDNKTRGNVTNAKERTQARLRMYALDDAIKAEREKNGDGSAALIQMHRDYASAEKIDESTAAAITHQRMALELAQKAAASSATPDARKLETACQADLALELFSVGQYDEAGPMLETAATACESSDPALCKKLLEARAKLLYKQNKIEQANEIYKKLKSM